SLRLKQHEITLRAVAFGKGDWEDPLNACDVPFQVAFQPVINNFRNRRTVELHLIDWRVPPE
ncbi:MAG: single-stranded-DNA-specific exonuclease RecJ, partial [Planctomycetales bacterium]